MRFFVPFLLALQLAFTPAAQAQTVELDSAEFGAAVRAYLLENPQVIMEAIAVLEAREAEAEVQQDTVLIQNLFDDLFNDGYSHIAGNPEGPILMVEFSDYRCPWCQRAHLVVRELIEANPDIRLVYKEFPILGEQSVLGSRAAVAVLINETPEIYTAMSDALMAYEGLYNNITLTEIAASVGADGEKMLEMMNTAVVTQILQSNRILGQRMNITGTPGFVIGDQMHRGYLPLEQLQILVDQARDSLNG